MAGVQGQKLRKLLFETDLRDGTPLFESAAEVVGRLMNAFTTAGIQRSRKSLATQLSAMFLDRRTCPPELEEHLTKLIEARFAERNCPTDPMLVELRSTIRSFNSTMRLGRLRESGAAAEDSLPEEVQSILKLLRVISVPKSLMVVEYRDLPRTYPTSKYEELLHPMGEAIVAGASFCMVQPYQSCREPKWHASGKSSGQQYQHAAEVREFLGKIMERVRLSHDALHRVVRKLGETRGLLPEEREKAARRIVLYERNSESVAAPTTFTTGIQSRLLYVYYPSSLSPFATKVEEIWEWLTGRDHDYFIQRDPALAPVIAAQFFPFVSFWHENEAQLPLTEAELSHALSNSRLGARLPPDTWVIYQEAK